jgi:hypothetical protein
LPQLMVHMQLLGGVWSKFNVSKELHLMGPIGGCAPTVDNFHMTHWAANRDSRKAIEAKSMRPTKTVPRSSRANEPTNMD